MSTWINETLRINHQTLTTVRFIENRFLPLIAIFSSFTKALEVLYRLNSILCETQVVTEAEKLAMEELLNNYKSLVGEYVENVAFLQKRSGRTAQMISDTLAFKNQEVAQLQSRYTWRLTLSTVEDSASVRVVTAVTLIYLPFTFVAVRSCISAAVLLTCH